MPRLTGAERRQRPAARPPWRAGRYAGDALRARVGRGGVGGRGRAARPRRARRRRPRGRPRPGVGMAVQAELEGDGHPAEDQRPPGDQRVRVHSLPDPQRREGHEIPGSDRRKRGGGPGGSRRWPGRAAWSPSGSRGRWARPGPGGRPARAGRPHRPPRPRRGGPAGRPPPALRGRTAAGSAWTEAARGRRCRWSAGRRRPGGWCRSPAPRGPPRRPASRSSSSIRSIVPGATRAGGVVHDHIAGLRGQGPEPGGHAGLAGRPAGDQRGHLGQALVGEQLAAASSVSGWLTTTTAVVQRLASIASTAWAEHGPPSRRSSALAPPPRRRPAPAAAHGHAHRREGGGRERRTGSGYDSSASSTSRMALPSSQWQARRARRRGPARAPEHALLPGGQALLTVADGEVADDLGDLEDVARLEALDVALEAAAPVALGGDSPVRRISKTPSTSSELHTSRIPTSWQLSRARMRVRSPYVSLRTRYSLVSPLTSRSWRPSMTARAHAVGR